MKHLKDLTANVRNRLNDKPDDKLPVLDVYPDRMYGVFHVVKDGQPLCGMVKVGELGQVPSTRRPSCPFCIDAITPDPQPTRKKKEEADASANPEG